MSDTAGVTAECTCGYNAEGQAYCPLFPGDAEYQNLITKVQTAINYNTHCNTYSRGSYGCYVGSGDDALTAFWNVEILALDLISGNYPLR